MALGSRDHGQEQWEGEMEWQTGQGQWDPRGDDRVEILLQGQLEAMERISTEELQDPVYVIHFWKNPSPSGFVWRIN